MTETLMMKMAMTLMIPARGPDTSLLYLHMYVYTYIYTDINVYTCMYVYIYTCTYIYVYICDFIEQQMTRARHLLPSVRISGISMVSPIA